MGRYIHYRIDAWPAAIPVMNRIDTTDGILQEKGFLCEMPFFIVKDRMDIIIKVLDGQAVVQWKVWLYGCCEWVSENGRKRG